MLYTRIATHHHNLKKPLAFFLSAPAQSPQSAPGLKDAVPEDTPLWVERLEEST